MLYEYKCVHCGQLFQDTCRVEERDQARKCPHCGSMGTRIISVPPPASFKGAGFYATEYRRERKQK